MLHTITNSPNKTDFTTLCAIVQKNDAIVLLQDGILCGLIYTYSLKNLRSISTFLYALKVDVLARGLHMRFSSNIVLINYNQFVDLSVQHKQQLSW